MSIRSIPRNVILATMLFALFTSAIHIFTNLFAGYEIFRDELYYIACSKRLDAGYVDHPPFSIFMLFLSRNIFGESLFAIRLFPAIVSGLTVFFTGLLTFRLGGSLYAITAACTAIVFAPIFIAMNSVYSMNTYDYFFWVFAVYIIVLIINHEKKHYWYLLGVVTGLALLNKTGFLWFGAGLFIGLLLTSPKLFLKKEVYFAGAIALLIFSPYLIWNIFHDFAHLEFISNATRYKYSGLSRMDFIAGQVLLTNPLTLPVWLAGLFYFFFHKEGKKFRIIGIIYLVSFIILFLNGKSKPEYLGTAYPVLFAGGGVMLEIFFSGRNLYYLKYGILLIIAAVGFILIPFAMPVLPVESFISYKNAIGLEPGKSESHHLNELPQFYADMFGWENMAATVSESYMKLTPEDRKKVVLFAGNYGEAGAIEYFSDTYPLPPVISPHNSYWYWVTEIKQPVEIVMVLGGSPEDHTAACESVESIGLIQHQYSMPYESNLPIYLCRKLMLDIEDIWSREKKFI
jgi:hypothetical protein